ncbi:MAG: PAS domain-containing sensor histidine kinase [Alphaproteobacteria bacterium]|nr:PAS domain-containing sensor histidine kinase [Alphaproteobacteria bacterium]MDE2631148.1 PAS domain-containing sensor histidine kinase [Alphaproteobacteria bacterium]
MSVEDRRSAKDQDCEKAYHAYRLMAEEASDIVILHEPDGHIFFASSALERILKRTAAEIEQQKFFDLIHPDDMQEAAKVNAVPLPGKMLSATYRTRHGDGHYIWVETTTRGIYDHKTGELHNLISVSRDVTERMNHELAVKAAQERAESANKAKSRFLANMSHELRTPLNAVIGFTDLMRQRTFGPLGSERYEEYATLIYDSGQLLLDLISDMLDMAKIEAGRLELNYERVDVNGTVEDCVRMLRDRADNNGLELTLSLPEEPLFLIADKRAVKQVLLNLLTNALKFTPAGGHVGVIVRYGDSLATITVRDTGVGIPAKELPRLGNPFEQVNSDPMLAKGGSGLGLALVRALMEKHGGKLSIESEEGVGTAVCVTFPLIANKRAAA